MSIISRITQAFRAIPAARASSGRVDIDSVSQRIDAMIADGTLPTHETAVRGLTALSKPRTELKENNRKSRLDIRSNDNDMVYAMAYNQLRDMVRVLRGKERFKDLPYREDPSRDEVLAEYWRNEPILAGAVYSMTAKMVSLKWSVTGTRRKAMEAARMFARAAHYGGYDWGGYKSSVAQDFFTTNRGVFIELAKEGDPLYSPTIDIGHMDALCCTLTGNSQYPVAYRGYHNGQYIRFQPGEFIHFSSMNSPREKDLGIGFCAVDRAFRAANLLLGLHQYDQEKLDNLPPEGVAAISGLTMDEVQDALRLWQAKREQDKSLTFPQVLWLIGSNANTQVRVDFQGFSQIPEQFDRKVVVEQYVQTLALAFGVDVREFWSLTSGGLGTAGESEVQHLKAKGKGPGEFLSISERMYNGELTGCEFAYDTQDIEEDANAAAVAKAWVDAYLPLYNLQPAGQQGGAVPDAGEVVGKARGNPRPDKPNGAPTLPTPMIQGVKTGGNMESMSGGQQKSAEQVITKVQFLRLLADRGVIPDWMVNDERIMIEDTDVHNLGQGYKSAEPFHTDGDPDDTTCIFWEKGVLKERRLPAIILNSRPREIDVLDVEVVDGVYTEQKALPIPAESIDFTTIQGALSYLRAKEAEILGTTSKIRGEPIPEAEASRGSRPTRKVVQEELERWRKHPVLSAYVPSVEEEAAIIEGLS